MTTGQLGGSGRTAEQDPLAAARRHRISLRDFDALGTGTYSESAIDVLTASERSRRLLLLRHLVDSAGDLGANGPLPAPIVAWELLAAAQRRCGDALTAVLDHPPTGQWLAHTLRPRRWTVATDDVPRWHELGYLHAIAASAAIRSGLTFSIQVPMRNGIVVLPTLGVARLPGRQQRYAVAEVRAAAGRAVLQAAATIVPVGGDSGAARLWRPAAMLRMSATGQETVLPLETDDPYRGDVKLLPPEEVSASTLRSWQEVFQAAWELLVRHHPQAFTMVRKTLRSVAPLPSSPFRVASSSNKDSFGAVRMSLPPDPAACAVTLIHESRHSVLTALMHMLPLVIGDDEQERFFAPWRNDPRPLTSLLHGAYSYVGIVDFWRVYRNVGAGPAAALANFEFAHWRKPTWHVIHVLRARPELTPAGRRLVAGLARRMAGWLTEPVPRESLAAGAAMAADRRALWRLRHLRPDPWETAQLAEDWLAQRPRSKASCRTVLAPDPAAAPSHPRGILTRIRLGRPALFAELRATPGAIGKQIPHATPADLTLVSGAGRDAVRAYQERLDADPADFNSSIGLALALGGGPAARILLDRPELIRGVQREAWARSGVRADPLRLAAWLARPPRPAAIRPQDSHSAVG